MLRYDKKYYNQRECVGAIFTEVLNVAGTMGVDASTSADTKLAIIYAGNTYYSGGGLNPSFCDNSYIMSEVQGRPYDQENAKAGFSHIGLHCHEFAHTLRIGHSSGSRADLMCSGRRNGSVEGNVPAPLNPVARMKAGRPKMLSLRITSEIARPIFAIL